MSTDTHHEHEHGPLYEGLTVKRLPNSEAELVGTVPLSAVDEYHDKALRRLTRDLELPGFRKGHVPLPMAAQHLGEQAIMEHVAELVLSHAYPHMVDDEKLDVVGRPAVTITKLAPGNPIGFRIVTALYPDITLPDYHALAEKARIALQDPETVTVSEADADDEVKRIHTAMKEAQHAAAGNNSAASEGDASLLAIDDAFARSLGAFDSLTDLKEKLKAQLLLTKKQKAHDARRIAIADALVAATTFEIPNLFVENELEQMFNGFVERVERAGMKLDEYLSRVGKTREELRKEWRPDAEKQARIQLILFAIARKENLSLDTERMERDVAHLAEHYEDGDPDAIRSYVRTRMTNDLVFRILEGETLQQAVPAAASE